ncbi:MAG: YncE family protein [Gemmatimonadaceae bacterium]
MWTVRRRLMLRNVVCVAFLLGRMISAQDTLRRHPIAEKATATLRVKGFADFLVIDGDHAWVTNEGRVERLSPNDSLPVATVPIAEPCGAMAVDFGALWVVNCRAKTLVRVNLSTARVVTEIPTGVADASGELSVATGGGSVWLLTDSTGILSRIDPTTNKVTARIPVQPHSFATVFGFGSVWITTTGSKGARDAGSVQRIDPATNAVVATIRVGPTPRFLAAGEGGVWTLNQGDGTVSRIDPATNRLVATIPAGVAGGGGDIAAGAGRIWVRASKVLLQVIDPKRNAITERYGPPAGSGAVRANARHVWVTAHDIHTVWVLPPTE